VACLILWQSRLLLPLKLFTTFLHEFGHAGAAWLTCSKVHGIEVHRDQGGLTHWSTTSPKCASFFVLPAGYLASAVWGAALVICSSDDTSAVVISLLLCVFMLITLLFQMFGKHKQPEITLTVLLISLMVLLGGLVGVVLFTEWPQREVPLRVVLLLMGVMNSIFATYDIWTDCIKVDNPKSDAHKFSEALPCCCPCLGPRLIGGFWLLLSLTFVCFSVWLTLLLEAKNDKIESFEDIHAMTWVAIVIGAGTLGCALAWNCCCHTRKSICC